MNGKKARRLRKMALALTTEGAPFAEAEARHQIQIVPYNWPEFQAFDKARSAFKEAAILEKDEGVKNELTMPSLVTPDFEPYIQATFVWIWGCTKNIYKQLKAESKGKSIPMPQHVKDQIAREKLAEA